MAYTTIDKPTDYFRVKTYSGNSSTQSITWNESDNMKPDLLWLKGRGYADGHALVDVIRGSTKNLSSDSTTAEFTQTNGVTSFDTNGWSMGNWSAINRSTSGTAVGWGWLAGGTGVSNTDGSITSTVSANTTSGFSICAFNGNSGTVGHGLGAKPDFLVVKSRDTGGSNNWVVTHSALGTNMADKYLILNGTDAGGTSSNVWGGEPTSTTFTVTGAVAANDNNIAYLFTEKKGYSKFGSYTGNGNADGTFVYTGFSPSLVMVKASSTTGNWTMFDNKRSPFNFVDNHLYANTSVAEQTASAGYIDFLSNGFKKTDTFNNASGATYIYMAFAEAPFVTSTRIPTVAR